MKSGLTTKGTGLLGLKKQLAALTKNDVLVGVPEADTERKDGDPATNALLGYVHENGSPAAGIPARPWLAAGLLDAKPKVSSYMRQAGVAALNGNAGLMDRCLHAAGLAGAAGAKNKIDTGPFVELKEATLAARRAKGRTGEKPLVDTHQLLNSVTYVLRKKESA